jgi:hypothetical protein
MKSAQVTIRHIAGTLQRDYSHQRLLAKVYNRNVIMAHVFFGKIPFLNAPINRLLKVLVYLFVRHRLVFGQREPIEAISSRISQEYYAPAKFGTLCACSLINGDYVPLRLLD